MKNNRPKLRKSWGRLKPATRRIESAKSYNRKKLAQLWAEKPQD